MPSYGHIVQWGAHEYQTSDVSCTVAKTLSFFLSSGQNVWTSVVLIRTSQSRKLLAQRDKFEKKLL
jgi:hypothetical protein